MAVNVDPLNTIYSILAVTVKPRHYFGVLAADLIIYIIYIINKILYKPLYVVYLYHK